MRVNTRVPGFLPEPEFTDEELGYEPPEDNTWVERHADGSFTLRNGPDPRYGDEADDGDDLNR